MIHTPLGSTFCTRDEDCDAERDTTGAVMPDTRSVYGAGDEERHPILEDHGYRILKMLGKGSYATVKLAFSERHQANVAVKIISKREAPPEYLEKFLPREISIVKTLKHHNIVVFLQVVMPDLPI